MDSRGHGAGLLDALADRLERRKPYAFAMAFLAAGLVVRFDGFGMGHAAWFTVLAFWFFAIGWAASKASTVRQRAVVTGFLAIGVIGYFGEVHRELLVFAGLGLLIWLPGLRCPSALTAVAGVLAEASLVIYLALSGVSAVRRPPAGGRDRIGAGGCRPHAAVDHGAQADSDRWGPARQFSACGSAPR